MWLIERFVVPPLFLLKQRKNIGKSMHAWCLLNVSQDSIGQKGVTLRQTTPKAVSAEGKVPPLTEPFPKSAVLEPEIWEPGPAVSSSSFAEGLNKCCKC